MSISIKSNIAAMNAQRRLGESTAQLSQSFTRLSSGLRINRAADDAAGLAIASGLNADARVYTQGVRNINDAISVLDVAESALGELSNIVNRQLELAQQAANGVLTLTQRRAIDDEVDALTEEYNRIIRSTSFNGFQLLDQSNTTFQVQAGYGAIESLQLALGQALDRNVSNGVYTNVQTLNGGSSRAWDTLAVDLDGDGHLDVITNSDVFSILSVELGRGDGTFKANTNYVTPSVSTGLAVSDLDGDGKLDAVLTYGSTYTIMLGNGDGSFRAATSYDAGFSSSIGAELVDLNGDGRLDLVSGNAATGTIGVLFGQAGGTFGTMRTFATGSATLSSFAIGDANNDGITDVVASDNSGHIVNVLLGTGSGTFGAGRSFATDTLPRGITFSDLNDDGKIDIVVAAAGVNKFNVLLGNGDGTFSARMSFDTGADTSAHMYAVDLNGDGIPDVVQPDTGAGSFKIVLGNGDGTFKAVVSITSGTSPNAAAVADFNEDGVPDIVIKNQNGSAGFSLISGVTTTTLMPLLNVTTQHDARSTLTFLREQLARISLERGSIGAMQSRLGFAANVLEQRRQNYAAASSAISDVDVATEAAQLVRSRILQQAGAAVLAQANQAPAMALILLGGRR